MSSFETLPQPLFCLTLAHSIDDVDAMERYLAEYPRNTEACMPMSLRTALETTELPPIPHLSTRQLLDYLTVLWKNVDVSITPHAFGLPRLVIPDKVFQSQQIDTKIVEAAKVGALYLIPYFTTQNPWAVSNSYGPALAYAAERGDLEMVKYLLKRSIWSPEGDRNESGSATGVGIVHYDRDLPIMNAAAEGHLDVVKFLTERGARIHGDHDEPLMLAMQNGHPDVVRFILSRDVHVSSQMDDVLLHAAGTGFTDIVNTLLDRGVGRNRDDMALNAAAGGGHIDTVKALIDRGIRSDYALFTAAEHGQSEVIQLLLKRLGNDVEMISTALVAAAQDEDEDVLTLLLQNGIDINIGDGEPLIKAVGEDRFKAVEFLLEHKANPHLRNETALMDAVAAGYDSIVDILIEGGADVHAQNNAALISAAGSGNEDIVDLLLHAKANIHARGDAALTAATENGHADVVKLLVKHSI